MTHRYSNNLPGLYQIVNTTNGHRYVGQASRLDSVSPRRSPRWCQHLSDLRLGRHHNGHLQRAWNKYGEYAFRFEIIAFCEEHELDEIETDLLNHEPKPEYNISRDGSSPRRGVRHTAEAREKIRAAKMGNKQRLGKPHSEETKEKLRRKSRGNKYRQGKAHSADAKEKMRNAKKACPILARNAAGDVVLEFRSINEAGRAGHNMANIMHVLNGRSRTCKGLTWERVEQNTDPIRNETPAEASEV